jgi:ABC-type branched-subunit amino acid transport system substrate-binding protein
VGYDVLYSARLAVRQANADPGRSYRVALVALDDSGDTGLAGRVAASLVVDPAVVAVVGHWQAETTAAARPVYEEAGLALLAMAGEPEQWLAPGALPDDFTAAYQAVTPFDETAGPLAWPAYEAFQMVLSALALAEESGDPGARSDVATALQQLTGGPEAIKED